MKNLFTLNLNGLKTTQSKMATVRQKLNELNQESNELICDTKKVDEDILMNELREKSNQISKLDQEKEILSIQEYIYQINLEKVFRYAFELCIDILPSEKKLNKKHFEKVSEKMSDLLGVDVLVARRAGFHKNDLSIYFNDNETNTSMYEIIYSFLDNENRINQNRKKYDVPFCVEDPHVNALKILEVRKEIEKKKEEIKALEKLERDYQYRTNA